MKSTTAQLEIRLLGGFRVAVSDRPLPESAWRRKRAADIVKLLALEAAHRLHREQIVDALWPDLDPDAAANNLRVALHRARRRLEEAGGPPGAYLVRDGDNLVLALPDAANVDVDAFERAVAAAWRSTDPAASERALDLYTGELLPENRYEEWAESRRAALRAAYLTLLARTSQLYEQQGELGRAIALLERATAAEPLAEEAHVALIRLLALTGQRKPAMEQVVRLVRILKRELGAEPQPATRELALAIRDGRFPEAVLPLEPPRPAPVQTPRTRRRSVPAVIDGLIGRERELAELTHLLGRKRLVTLTGPGGVGKTRLAQAIADATAESFPDGADLVELAPVQNPALIVPAIARALGVQETSDLPLLDAVASAVEGERLLLVVDNCEHLAGVAEVLANLLARCPQLAVLATSRARLRIKGEQEYPVSPLAVPEAGPELPAALPHRTGLPAAVTLFVERASAARPDFTLTAGNAPAVAEIVRRLDGLPLAIELAAARVRILSPAELLARLAQPLDLLTGGPRDAPVRHQTLRATIAWSFDLLAGAEPVLFRRLAVFAGGFTLDAAEDVGGDAALSSVFDTLSSLVDQNLVIERRRLDGEIRFGMLETIREFALEQLAASGEEAAVRDAHAAHELALAERAREEFKGADQAAWLERIDVEHDNLRAALGWLLHTGAGERALRLAAALWWFWWVRGHLSEGRAWLEQAVAATDDSPLETRARALYGAGSLAEAQGDYEQAARLHEDALALYRTAGDQEGVADALASLGQMARDQGDYDQAVRLLDEALATCRAAGDHRGAAYALIELGTVASYRGGGQLALALYAEGLEILRPLADSRGYAAALTNVATMTFVQGDPERAAPLYEEALNLWHDLGDEQGRATVLTNLGEIMQHRGDLEQALTFYREALPIYQQTGDRRNAAAVLTNLGQVARERGDLLAAAALLAGSADVYRAMGDQEAMARSLEALAGLAVAMGEAEQGTRLFGRAEALRDEIGAPLAIIAAERYEQDVAAARALLPEQLFAAAWSTGRALPMTEAITEATRLASGLAREERAALDDALQDFPL